MSSKINTIFRCTHCDAQYPKWTGRCDSCGKWSTITQEVRTQEVSTQHDFANVLEHIKAAAPQRFSEIAQTKNIVRMKSGIGEWDRVLGGGIVPGAVVLVGGDPGIGKSTLIAQVASSLSGDVLYVSGEETGAQIALRLRRLKLPLEHLQYLGEEHVEVICKTIQQTHPQAAIIDSMQTVASSSVDGDPGSVTQIKAAAVRFLEIAKSTDIPIIIIGHVTKGGDLGGPKTLEHLVDVVLYLEGDPHHHFRILRSVKNRFGSTNEIGIFTMEEQGLVSVDNPSQIFLRERSLSSGSCMTAIREGSRVLLIEVQALVSRAGVGFPQRRASGIDVTRLNMLIAVLRSRLDVSLDGYDVHVNIAGGIRTQDPSIDGAIAVALVSALRNISVSPITVVMGEVGLGGEMRSVPNIKERIAEAMRFGLTKVITPIKIRTLREALNSALQPAE